MTPASGTAIESSELKAPRALNGPAMLQQFELQGELRVGAEAPSSSGRIGVRRTWPCKPSSRRPRYRRGETGIMAATLAALDHGGEEDR